MKTFKSARNSYLKNCLLAFALTAGLANTELVCAQAQEAPAPLKLNGIAPYVNLGTQFYIGALYNESLQDSPEAAIFTPAHKRMVMLITVDKWRSRQFAKAWQHMISINNDAERLEKHSQSIIAFTRLAQGGLNKDDIILVEMIPGNGTTVKLNGKLKISDPSDRLFSVLVSTWIGNVPPSSDFKDMMLDYNPDNPLQRDLLVELEKFYKD